MPFFIFLLKKQKVCAALYMLPMCSPSSTCLNTFLKSSGPKKAYVIKGLSFWEKFNETLGIPRHMFYGWAVFSFCFFLSSPSITNLQGQCEKSTRTKNAWRHRSRNVEIPQVKCSDRVWCTINSSPITRCCIRSIPIDEQLVCISDVAFELQKSLTFCTECMCKTREEEDNHPKSSQNTHHRNLLQLLQNCCHFNVFGISPPSSSWLSVFSK